jgi:uncharacterized membrane protein
MARTATKQRSSAARRARDTAKKSPAKAATKAAKKPAAKAAKKPAKKLARGVALKALKAFAGKTARKTAQLTAQGVRAAAERATTASKGALESGLASRLPIQASIDVAVPLLVAWEEWMTFDPFTEGVHRIEDVERDGDELVGTIPGPRSVEWRAEIVDERDQEAFAWRSVEGSDCAGLITFHRLSDRLTRIEVDLDVVPTNPAETLTLSLHLAHHRVTTDLRRFKARVEFINPDVYEAELRRNGNAPDAENDNAPEGENDE